MKEISRKYKGIVKKYVPLHMGPGTWKNFGHWPLDLDKFQSSLGGSQIQGLEGTLEERHETCQNVE